MALTRITKGVIKPNENYDTHNIVSTGIVTSVGLDVNGSADISGSLSVGGVLTYEDVTSIDSVGLITARSGVSVNSGGIQVLAGVSRFNANIIGTATTTLSITAADESSDTSCNVLFATAASGNIAPKTGTNLTFNSSNGTLTATTFSGSGASLTSIPAANITGTLPADLQLPAANLTGTVADARISTLTASKLTGALPAISGANLTNLPADTPTNTDIQVVYTVTANGSSAYRFGGNGIVSTEDNPDVYLIRGLKYRFINNSGGSHPFQIRQSSGGSAYSAGVTNNGASSGNIDFQVPYSAPSRLYYQCTSHGGMVGNLYIRGAGGQNTNVGVTTFSGDVYLGNDIYLTDGSGGYEQVEVAANDIRVEHKHIHSEFDVWVRSTSVTDRKNGIVGDGNDLLLYSNTTSKVRIASGGDLSISDGNLVVASGHGIDFSATGDGSGTDSSELLDDYEEGSWTPTITGGAITVSGAYYTKIARVVHWYLYGNITNTANDSSQFRIYGLPYTVGGNGTGLSNYYGNVASFNYTASANNTGLKNLAPLAHGAQDYIYFHFIGGGDPNPPTNSYFHSHLLNQSFIISGVYFV